MKAWAVVRHEAPLECLELPDPEAQGTEVVLEVTRCGVCHSDLHFWHGVYNMGGGRTMSLADRGVTLPRAPGHEIVGRVVSAGPEAEGVAVGDSRVVYPWLGCGRCERCLAEQDNLCLAQRSLGVMQNGGFGALVKVPHPRYLVDFGDLDPSLAATYACSGLTVYSAVKKIMPVPPDAPVLLFGAGGLGLAAIAMLHAFGHRHIVSVDLAEEKRRAALQAGATKAVDGSGEDVTRRIIEAAGRPVAAAIDLVNTSATARHAFDALDKGGKLVLVGVAGGDLTLSLAGMIFRAQSVEGSNTGTPQDLRDVVRLAREGRFRPTPVQEFPKDAANDALMKLHRGEITGRGRAGRLRVAQQTGRDRNGIDVTKNPQAETCHCGEARAKCQGRRPSDRVGLGPSLGAGAPAAQNRRPVRHVRDRGRSVRPGLADIGQDGRRGLRRQGPGSADPDPGGRPTRTRPISA
jgi:alcohol dehydrogenase/propanol-preferring alcohol dehydrogenase